jgi:PIN domain nuclease of toxin-antitoxin system
VRILLDTQVLVWLATGNENELSKRALRVFLSSDELFFSIASYWELCIKRSVGKINWDAAMEGAFQQGLRENGVVNLPILNAHCDAVAALPLHHRDPFDRMLIAQAVVEDLAILSADTEMRRYGVKVLW